MGSKGLPRHGGLVRPIIVIFDGPSGAGKTTLHYAVDRARGWKDFNITRLTPSHWVYAKVRGEDATERVHQVERGLMEAFSPLWVLVYADTRVCYERLVKAGKLREKPYESTLEDLGKVNDLFLEYFLHHCLLPERVWINTGITSPEEAVLSVVAKIGKMELDLR